MTFPSNRWLTGFALAIVFGALAGNASAQRVTPESLGLVEQIQSFDSTVQVTRDGAAEVTETIVYDFGKFQRHGIYRYVPVRYQDDQGNKFYAEFTPKSVTDETGRGYHYTRQSNDTNKVLKIGDANKTITGAHTYKISYELKPVVRQGNGADLFIFNVTGNGWQVPIQKSSGTISYANGIVVTGNACYTGPVGSKASECGITPAGNGISVSANRPLQPGEGLTVANDLQPGSVNNYLVAGKKTPIHWQRGIGYIIGILAALLGVLLLFGKWIIYRVRRSRATEVPQFESPDNLTPAEIGMLIDNRSNMTEVTATLIDLSVRKYMRIEQISPKGLLKKAKYKFVQLKEAAGLNDYEQQLFAAIFNKGKEVKVDDLDRTAMAAAVSSFRDQVKQSLEAKGYYGKTKLRFSKLLGLLWVAIVVASMVVVFRAGSGFGNLIGNAAATGGGLLFLALLPLAQTKMTDTGYTEWGNVAGFRRFLSMTEKERLKFTDAPDKTPKLFSALLPYAIALGVEKEWAKQFEGIDISKQTGTWYYGPAFISPVDLTNDLSSFGGAVSTNFAPVSTSSGGSSGGFSGGGGGGGGGGSW